MCRFFALSFAFAVGLAITFMLLGVVAALIGGLGGASTTWWYYLVAFVCLVIGLNMIGLIHIEAPLWLGGLRERIALLQHRQSQNVTCWMYGAIRRSR